MGEGSDRADVVVVADGGSTDGTRDVILDSGARLLEGARGRGPQLVAAADQLLEEGAEVLLFLHADSLPGAGALAAVRTAFDGSSLVAAGLAQRVEAPGRAFRWIEAAANARVRRGMVFGDSALSVRASDYLAVGGFDPLPLFEDVELSDRLRGRGPVRLLEDAEIQVCARRWEEEGGLAVHPPKLDPQDAAPPRCGSASPRQTLPPVQAQGCRLNGCASLSRPPPRPPSQSGAKARAPRPCPHFDDHSPWIKAPSSDASRSSCERRASR